MVRQADQIFSSLPRPPLRLTSACPGRPSAAGEAGRWASESDVRFLRSQFAHYVLWALLLLLFVVVRPRPWSPLFLALFGLAMALGIWLMWRSHREAVASKRAFATWQARIQSLAPAMDVDDDGHLYESLDPPQWEAVFSELERVPRGSRSLRQAMGVVAPEALA